MTLIDGKKIASEIKEELTYRVYALNSRGIFPELSVVIVGSDPASLIYIRDKKRACEETGIRSVLYELPEETSEDALLELIETLNTDRAVTGILVQFPLPKHINGMKIQRAVLPAKDVDCFHPMNTGLLSIGEPLFLPCTPAGIIQLLKRSGVEIEGKHCVVVGRSNIVGKPMAQLLLAENGTVTICHSRTRELSRLCAEADILVAALGKPRFITADFVKDGAVVIDVGIHRADGKLCGDVDFENVARKTSFISPVPGGVGPMTIAMLMQNCVLACEN